MVEEIVEVARAVHYEMSYLNHVSRSDVVSESSFKYPAVEWLERQGGKDKVFFEKGHPVFFKRMTDISWVDNGVFNYIEMKYVKKKTAGLNEQQRYFDDLLRLVHILIANPSSRVYFLACGQTDNWMPCFQNLDLEKPTGSVPIEPYQEGNTKNKEIHGVYSKWFSFEGAKPTKIIETKDYSDFYSEFVGKYIFKEGKGNHPEGIVLKTTLLWISEVDNLLSPCATAVWKLDYV